MAAPTWRGAGSLGKKGQREGGEEEASEGAALPKYQALPCISSISCLCRICKEGEKLGERKAWGRGWRELRSAAAVAPTAARHPAAAQQRWGISSRLVPARPATQARTLTSDRERARRRGSATRCPKSTSRRRALQCASALRSRALPAMHDSTVSTTAGQGKERSRAGVGRNSGGGSQGRHRPAPAQVPCGPA